MGRQKPNAVSECKSALSRCLAIAFPICDLGYQRAAGRSFALLGHLSRIRFLIQREIDSLDARR